jgi:hypothetical protein
MFLDPLVTPPRIWLRWPVPRDIVQTWQQESGSAWTLPLEGGGGRSSYGTALSGQLQDVRLDERGKLVHPVRTAFEARTRLLHKMSTAPAVDEVMLLAYLRQHVGEEAVRIVILPLVRAYVRDPELLRRYNYGRGQLDQPFSEEDERRVQRARHWLSGLARQGFTAARLQELAKEIPFVGPYRAFTGYMDMLVALA